MLPGGWQVSHQSRLRHGPSVRVTLVRQSPSLIVKRTWPLVVEASLIPSQIRVSFPYLIYTLFERPRQQLGMCTIHAAAAVSPSGQGVLLLGDKGAGKTSILLALIERGYVPAGDDLVVVQADKKLQLRAGNRIARLRYRTSGARHSFYESKRAMRLDTQSFLSETVPLCHVFRVNVHPMNGRATITPSPTSGLNEGLRLFENTARYIRGMSTPFLFRAGVPIDWLPSLDDPSCIRMRTRLIRRLLSSPVMYLSSRTADEAANQLSARIR